jgi:hypothetical protein
VDPQGRPLQLRQEDWRIDYAYDSDDPQALPDRLFIEREEAFNCACESTNGRHCRQRTEPHADT